MKKVLISVFVLSVLFGSLSAAPFQTLGMLRTPDAYVLPHKAGEILLVGYYRDVAKPSTADPDRSKGFYPYGMLSVGLFDKAELGFFGGDKVYYFNAKLKLIEETLKIPQVSVGLDNMLSPVNRHRAQDHTDPNEWSYANHPDKTDYEYWSPYIVASKQVVIGGINWIFSLGAGSNRFTGQVPRSRVFNGIFYSVNFSPLRNLHFQAEYSGHDFQAGVKYDIGKFAIKFAGQALEDLYKTNGYEDNLRLALGVSYLFDKYATSKRMPDLRELAQADDLILTDDALVAVDDTTRPKPGVPGTEIADGSLDFSTLPDSDLVLDGSKYDQLSPEIKELMEELTLLRQEREKAHKALLDLRKWLEEQQNR
ncbi:MAG: YjbH domain-containing protein [Candidatus Cloacimonetes bacterium]|nr:YjbH domain-containing protein [Candidatus Cloacimonadota bacterium]NLO11529.1 YjbH domain-containing protein [Candidatus Cloacimonadota bacterium]